MKKTVIVFAAIFCINRLAFAQDRIVVEDGKELKVRVITVSSDGVEYRLYDVQDSPLYRLKIQDIVSLTYENGTTEDLSLFLSKPSEKPIPQAITMQKLKFYREDNAFYLGERRLLETEIEKTLAGNSSAFNLWENGNRIKKINLGLQVSTGILIPVGSALIIVGIMQDMAVAAATISLAPWMLLSGTPPPENHYVNYWYAVGIPLLAAGVITGILIPVTKAHYKSCYSDAVNTYNKGLSKTAVSLHIGTTGTGFGLNLKF